MKTTDIKWLQPAMDVVAKTDPATWKRMDKADWTVHPVSDPSDLDGIDPWSALQLADELDSAFGVTVRSSRLAHPDVYRTTWLNVPMIENKARDDLKVPVAHFAADVLVHEFNHREGGDESDAFKAGTAFAQKMGDPSVASFSRETGQREVMEEYFGHLMGY